MYRRCAVAGSRRILEFGSRRILVFSHKSFFRQFMKEKHPVGLLKTTVSKQPCRGNRDCLSTTACQELRVRNCVSGIDCFGVIQGCGKHWGGTGVHRELGIATGRNTQKKIRTRWNKGKRKNKRKRGRRKEEKRKKRAKDRERQGKIGKIGSWEAKGK